MSSSLFHKDVTPPPNKKSTSNCKTSQTSINANTKNRLGLVDATSNSTFNQQDGAAITTGELNYRVDLGEDAPLLDYEEQSFSTNNNNSICHSPIQQENTVKHRNTVVVDSDNESIFKVLALVPGWYTIIALVPIIRRYGFFVWTKISANKYYIISITGGLVLSLLYGFAFFFNSELVYVHRASFVRFTEQRVVNVNPKGLDLFLTGHVFFDYSDCNWFQKIIFVPISFFLGTVSLNFTGPIDVFYNFPDIDSVLINPAKLYLPDMSIDVSPGSYNTFAFGLKMDITTDLANLYNRYLYSLDGSGVNITLLYKMEFKLNKILNLGKWISDARYNFVLTAENFSLLPDFEVKHFNLESNTNLFQTKFDVLFDPAAWSINANITSIEWDAYIPGCGATLLYIGSVLSSEVEINPLEQTSVSFKASIPKLDRKVQRFCPDGVSPLNRFVNQLLDTSKDAKVFLKAKSLSDINRELPKWFELFLSNTFQPITLDDTDYIDFLHFEPLDYTISQSAIMVLNNAESPLRFQSEVLLKLPPLPWDLSNQNNQLFDLTRVMGDFAILDENDDILLKVALISWQDVLTEGSDLYFTITDSLLDIGNTDALAKFLGDILNGVQSTAHYLLKSNLDLEIKTPISNSILQRVEGTNRVIIPQFDPNDNFFTRIVVENTGFKYITTSNSTHMRHFINLEVSNSRNKFGLKFQYLNLNVVYLGTVIGTVEMSNVDLDQNESHSSQMTVISRWILNNETRSNLESLVSKYLSGNQPSVQLHGHEGTSRVPKVNSLINALPSVSFTFPTFFSTAGHDIKGFVKSIKIFGASQVVKLQVLNPFTNVILWLQPYQFSLIQVDSEAIYLNLFPTTSQYKITPGLSELEFKTNESELYRFLTSLKEQSIETNTLYTSLEVKGTLMLSTPDGFDLNLKINCGPITMDYEA